MKQGEAIEKLSALGGQVFVGMMGVMIGGVVDILGAEDAKTLFVNTIDVVDRLKKSPEATDAFKKAMQVVHDEKSRV